MDPSLPGLTRDGPLPEPLAAALAAKGPDYVPRTEHLRSGGGPKYTNRLILETSPYLLQHAHNPVNWYAWGDAPFARARLEGKLVLLSVGYSTCHWCHVMERESFEDEEIAAFLNQRYVAVKVDREERPDVDDVYMTVVQMMTGGGGWPMTVILTADREPIFGGTYFPARDGDRGARIGFLSILKQLDATWQQEPGVLVGQAQHTSNRIRRAVEGGAPGDAPGAEAIRVSVSLLAGTFDPVWGGFGTAPKFPRPVALDLLARYFRRTEDPEALRMLTVTLERMASGGMVDHVGGGFHRYSVDAEWLVPHFEKMLYDQAQLVTTYLEGYQITGRDDFAWVARQTLDYVQREMTHEEGGFFSATDADSPGPDGESEEGLFFTWTPAEIEAAVGPARARQVMAYYGVQPRGNFEGRTILSTPRPLDVVARELGVEPARLQSQIDEARAVLYDVRSRRPPPLRDGKVITAWNGLMISAFARGGQVLDEPSYVESARRAARFVLERLRAGGVLKRTYKSGSARNDAFLDDHAFLVQGLLDLFEATGEPHWIEEAIAIQTTLDTHFWDEAGGGYYFTGDHHERLLARDKPDYDGAEPAGGSIAALNLLRLEQLTGDEAYRKRAERLFAAHARALASGVLLPKMLAALDYYLDRPVQVVIVKPAGDSRGVGPLLATLRATYLPNRILSIGRQGDELAAQARQVPLVEGKKALKGKATAYVCRGNVCDLPTSDPAAFARELAKVDPLPASGP